jgi:hypothetical protein
MSKVFRFIAAAIGAGVTGGFAVGAQAATLQLSDPNCSDFQMTNPSPGVYALTCSAIPQAPTCTLTPSTASPVINANLTLTANCSQSPTSYAWTGCNPASATSTTCTVTQANTGVASYSVTGSNGVGPGQAATTAVTWVSSLTAPSNCTITPSNSSLPVGGGPVTLTANCTGGGAATNYAWSGGGLSQSGPNNQASANIGVTTTFSVTATNSAAGSGTASTTVSVATGTGGGGTISCAAEGYASTRTINLNWSGTNGNITAQTASVGGFGQNTAVVATFTTPAAGNTRTGQITFYDFGDPPTYRTAVLSTQPCGRGTVLASTEGLSTPLYFTVGTPKTSFPTLAVGTTYYFTVVNRQRGAETCQGSCNGKVELSKPSGL